VLVAGDGRDGVRDGTPARARFSEPYDLEFATDEAVYLVDAGRANRVRRIAPDGTVSTIAGGAEGFLDGVGAGARFATPSGIAIAPDGALVVADTGNHAIRRVTREGRVTTLAGDGVPGLRDGVGPAARFNGPMGVAVDATGRVYVADTYNDRVRFIAPDGNVSTLAGGGRPGFADGQGVDARFDTPTDIVLEPEGTLLLADHANDAVRRVTPEGRVSTPTGGPEKLAPRVRGPLKLAIGPDGRVIASERSHRIVELSDALGRHVLAGADSGFRNGRGEEARFRSPAGVAVAPDGRIVVADAGNRMVRRLDLPRRLELTPPASPRVAPGFTRADVAWLPLLWPVAGQDGPHEVAGTMGEARGNAGGEGRERFHAGVDIRADQGTEVLSVRDDKVAAPDAPGALGTLSEFISIGRVTYVHLRVGRDRRDRPIVPEKIWFVEDDRGRPTRARTRRGTWFRAGETIGTVNRFQHVHLNLGPSGEEVNALLLRLPGFVDTVPPVIAGPIQIVGENGRSFDQRLNGRTVVRGRVHVVVDAYDRVDGNAPRRRLGVYRLGYQVLDSALRPLAGFQTPQETIVFDSMPPGLDAPLRLFAPGSGIPFYGTRRTRFLYRVTTRVDDGRVVDAPWDTTGLAPGDYVLRVLVADASGNEALVGRDLPVTVIPPMTELP